jgi:hypothetical protein
MLTPDNHLHGGREGSGVPKPSGACACIYQGIERHDVGSHVAIPHAIQHRDGALQTPAPSTGARVDESIVCDNVGFHPGCKTMSDPPVRDRGFVAETGRGVGLPGKETEWWGWEWGCEHTRGFPSSSLAHLPARSPKDSPVMTI